MAQGLTADTLLLRQKYMPLARSNNNAVPPKAADSITVRCFLEPELLLDCPGKFTGDENEGGGRGELGRVTFGFCATEGEGEVDGTGDGEGDGTGEGEGDGDKVCGCDDDADNFNVFGDNNETICLRNLYRRCGGSVASISSSLR